MAPGWMNVARRDAVPGKNGAPFEQMASTQQSPSLLSTSSKRTLIRTTFKLEANELGSSASPSGYVSAQKDDFRVCTYVT